MSFWRQRNVLVTGCTGFMGATLSRRLVADGASVVGLVRDRIPSAPFFTSGLSDAVTCVSGDIENYPLLERVINEYEVDTVYHLAAQAIVGVANRNPLATFEANIRGTWNVLEACRRNRSVSRVVVASSDKAYGVHERLPYDESCALQGTHPYDVSKSCADLIALSYHATYDLAVGVTRCGNLFGPGDLNFSRIVPGTIRSVLDGERPLIRSDGHAIRDYVHVDDIATAYMLLAERMDDPGIRGKAFNFGTGQPVSVFELVETIIGAAGRDDLTPIVLNESSAEIQAQYLSSERANSLLGWSPGAPLADRISQTIDWYRDYLGRSGSGAA